MSMIIGRDARVAVLRSKLQHWKGMRRLAVREGYAPQVAACDASVTYFRTALSQESAA